MNLWIAGVYVAGCIGMVGSVTGQTIRTVHPGGPQATAPWNTATSDLQAALAASVAGDEVWIAAGTYAPAAPGGSLLATFTIKSGVKVYGGFAGTETSVAQRSADAAAHATILSGDLNGDDVGAANRENNSYTVVRCENTAVGTRLDRLVIRDGHGSVSGGLTQVTTSAGGVSCTNAQLEMIDCTIERNRGNASLGDSFSGTSGRPGAGLSVQGGSVLATRCRIRANWTYSGGTYCSNGSGRGGYAGFGGGVSVRNGALTLVDSEISGNLVGSASGAIRCALGGYAGSYPGAWGGGIYADAAQLTLRRCVISNNQAGGGGLGNGDSGGGGAASGAGGPGGGIAARQSTVRIESSKIIGNAAGHSPVPLGERTGAGDAGGAGGGLYCEGGTAIILNTLIAQNAAGNGSPGRSASIGCGQAGGAAGSGGAIYVTNGTGITIVGCTIADNRPGTPGAGAQGDPDRCWIGTTSCCSNGPTGAIGIGGLDGARAGNFVFGNTIAWANQGGDLAGLTNVTYSCVVGRTGSGVVGRDPVFRDPSAGDYRLSPASPCIDAGSNALHAQYAVGVNVDADGGPRFVDLGAAPDVGAGSAPLIDMGAFEFGACGADINGDGQVTTQDVLDYLDYWFALDMRADMDRSGTISPGDIFEFLNIWFAGC